MSQLGRLQRFNCGSANGRNRRNSGIAGRSGRGPLTEPKVGLAHSSECLLGSRLRPSKASERKLDGGEDDEGSQGFREVFEVLGETPVSSKPGEGALEHLAARQDGKALHIVAPLDDLHAQRWYLGSSAHIPDRHRRATSWP
jgi:hypothetical protein